MKLTEEVQNMKFEINKKALSSLVDMAEKAVAKKTTNPILSGIKIEVVAKELNVYATDLQTGFHGKTTVEDSQQDCSFVVDHKNFSEILKSLPVVSIIINYDNGVLSLESATTAFKLPTMNAAEFPNVIPSVAGSTVDLEREKILHMIEKVIFCASRDSDPLSRNLNSVYWDFRSGGFLSLVATDSYRLGISEINLQQSSLVSSFLLSLRSVEELRNVLLSCRSKTFRLNFDGSRALFSFSEDSVELALNVIDSKFPNYMDILPKAFKTKMVLSTSEFNEILRRVSIASGSSEQVKMDVNEELLTLSANSVDVGEGKDTITVEKEGNNILIAYSPRYLREAVEKIETTEFEFNISGETNPTVLKPFNDNSYMYIVMPIRLV